ncbi:hypothetical protein UT300012_22610 [Paraclostridium bifermentans]
MYIILMIIGFIGNLFIVTETLVMLSDFLMDTMKENINQSTIMNLGIDV